MRNEAIEGKNMNRILETTFLLFVIALIGYLTKYILNIFLAHYLIPSIFGELQVAMKVLYVLVGLTLFGTNVGAQRFLAKYLHTNKKSTAAHYVAWNLKLIRTTFLISLVFAAIASGLMFLLHVMKVRDINQYHLAIYMFWLAPFAAIVSLISCFLFSSDEVYFPAMLNTLFRYATELLLFLVAAILFGFSIDNNTTIIGILFFTYVFLSILGLRFLDAGIFLAIKNALRLIKVVHVTEAEWYVVSKRMIANNIIFLLTSTIDLFIVEVFDKNKDHVGYYAVILTISGLIWLSPMNIYQKFKSQISSLVMNPGGMIELQSRLDKINGINLAITGISAILIIYFSTSLLSLFGTVYEAARVPLILLVVGGFLRGTLRIGALLLLYSGFEQLLLKISTVEIILLCCLGPPATYFFDILGMAVVSAFIMILGGFLTLVLARKKLGVRCALVI